MRHKKPKNLIRNSNPTKRTQIQHKNLFIPLNHCPEQQNRKRKNCNKKKKSKPLGAAKIQYPILTPNNATKTQSLEKKKEEIADEIEKDETLDMTLSNDSNPVWQKCQRQKCQRPTYSELKSGGGVDVVVEHLEAERKLSQSEDAA